MHKYEVAVLNSLKHEKSLSLEQLIESAAIGKDQTLWAIDNLEKAGMISVKSTERKAVRLTDEGRQYATGKLPEEKLLERLSQKTIKISDLRSAEEQIGLQWTKRKNFIVIKNGNVELSEIGVHAISEGIGEGKVLRSLNDNPESIEKLSHEKKEEVENLTRRKLIIIEDRKGVESITITKKGTMSLGKKDSSGIDALDKNMLLSKSWTGKKFKPYDVNVKVEAASPNMKHPLRSLIDEIKDTYTSMGFSEISGPAIEPAFWVFDSLFMPQDHPARDAQDTFYLSNPDSIDVDDAQFMERMREEHESAWHDQWSKALARQAVLRTHMTSVSVRYMRKVLKDIIEEKSEYSLPLKLFSVGRMFRNENIDYRHLADFYQTDGIVIGKNLTMANLFDILIKIYGALDIPIRFKPSYFPFVEPGAEFQAYSKVRDEWIEMGGCGIIRSEITGISRSNIRVLAWGAGVERILLIKNKNLNGISELYNANLSFLRNWRMV